MLEHIRLIVDRKNIEIESKEFDVRNFMQKLCVIYCPRNAKVLLFIYLDKDCQLIK